MSVFLRQLQLLWDSRRVHVMLGWQLLFLAVLCYYGMDNYYDWIGGRGRRSFLWDARVLTNIMTGVGVLWSLLVWHAETPSKRDYQWSLPVDTTAHDVMRVAAGAVWLLLASIIAVAFAFAITSTLPDGGIFHIGSAFWISLFTVALIPYLIVSAITIVSDRPAEWLFAVAGTLLLFYVVIVAAPPGKAIALHKLFLGDFGLSRALVGWWYLVMTYSTPIGYDLRSRSLWAGATAFWLAAGVMVLTATILVRRRLQ